MSGQATRPSVAAVATLEGRGIEFLASETVHTNEHGALTKPCLGSVMFELVHDEPGTRAAPR